MHKNAAVTIVTQQTVRKQSRQCGNRLFHVIIRFCVYIRPSFYTCHLLASPETKNKFQIVSSPTKSFNKQKLQVFRFVMLYN